MKVPALTYIRANASLPGENFISQWGKLTEADKVELKRWADEEQELIEAQNNKVELK